MKQLINKPMPMIGIILLSTKLLGMDLREIQARLNESQSLRYVRECIDSTGSNVENSYWKLNSGIRVLPYLDFVVDYRLIENYPDGVAIRFPYFEMGYKYENERHGINSALFIPITHTIVSGECISSSEEKTTWFNIGVQEVLWSRPDESLASIFFIKAEWNGWVDGKLEEDATVMHDNFVITGGFDYPVLGFLCGLKVGMRIYVRENKGDTLFIYRELCKVRVLSPPIKNIVRFYGDWGFEKLLHHSLRTWSIGIALCPEVLNWRRK